MTISVAASLVWRLIQPTARRSPAGLVEIPVPCDPQPGPDRGRPRPMDDALEARAERLRHHLR
jgi:hypothetical protein